MNKLFLIGNGFDLAHGLKTKYSEFILWYLNKAFQKAVETNSSYDDKLLKIYFTNPIRLNPFNSVNDFKEVKKVSGINVQFEHQFIEDIISHTLRFNWVDIELKYYSYLTNLLQYPIQR